MNISISQHPLFEDILNTKWCSKCKTIKPLTDFAKDRTYKDGYYHCCKECKHADNVQRYQARVLAGLPTTGSRVCTRCKKLLSLSEFHPNNNTCDGRSSWCKECAKENARQTYIPKPKREYQPPTSKRCTECKQIKSVVDFPKEKSKRNGYGAKCKVCKRTLDSKRYHARPVEQSRTRDKNLRKNFGITIKEYNVMLEAQNGLCAVCKQEETRFDHRKKGKSSLAVDHCHKTGTIRDLLCFKCNYAFGLLQEDPERIRALLAYAEKWQMP